MSTIQYNNNTKKTMKPYCKVCHDSGKSEKEYTSHFVKSNLGPSGVVVCPTLLSQACTYCNKRGHTVKYCQSLKKQTKYEEEQEKQEEQERKSASLFIKTKPKINTKSNLNNKPKNTFAILDDCTDDEDNAKTNTTTNTTNTTKTQTKHKDNKQEEEFPALCTKSTNPTTNTKTNTNTNSYASIVLTTPKVKQTAIITPMPLPIKKPIIMSNWADDWSDSEDNGPLTIEDLNVNPNPNYYDIECDDEYSDSLSSYEEDDDYDDEDRAHIQDSVTCSNWRNFPRIHPYA